MITFLKSKMSNILVRSIKERLDRVDTYKNWLAMGSIESVAKRLNFLINVEGFFVRTSFKILAIINGENIQDKLTEINNAKY